ncbi:MAG: hypothetical protein JO104_02415 [Candidatus Eremiobacteraeota bacterium]|nr:hypothetical protein [Candidatus Eremiobacteraeota bacterium]
MRNDVHRKELVQIRWAPEGTTVFPTFEGTLTIRGENPASPSHLELDGAYTPPFGIAGQVFDAAIGHRIAKATAREFLKDVKHAIEGAAPE